MHWPDIVPNFQITNDTFREIRLADRTEVIPNPSYHFVNLLSTMGGGYSTFPLEEIGGHAISGFASRTEQDLRILFYAHRHEDTVSRSTAEFDIKIALNGLEWTKVSVKGYRVDSEGQGHRE